MNISWVYMFRCKYSPAPKCGVYGQAADAVPGNSPTIQEQDSGARCLQKVEKTPAAHA